MEPGYLTNFKRFRPALEVALSGYLSSVKSSDGIVQSLLPENLRGQENRHYQSALRTWKELSGMEAPPDNPLFQSEWDKPLCDKKYRDLLDGTSVQAERARLLAVASEHSSDWLHAIPVPALGLKLDNTSIRIACGLRLWSPLCQPHKCVCGGLVDQTGRHGLSCKNAKGTFPRHQQVNDILRSFQ